MNYTVFYKEMIISVSSSDKYYSKLISWTTNKRNYQNPFKHGETNYDVNYVKLNEYNKTIIYIVKFLTRVKFTSINSQIKPRSSVQSQALV